MVAAAPFRGLRFDPAIVGDLAAVTAPPYDVISADARDAYEARSPFNMVRLILAKDDGEGGYRRVGELLWRWRDQGALRLDPAPALYLYEEAYTLRGERLVQRGVLATVTLDDSGTVILPHERTIPGPVADRRRLLEATRTNLSPVFGLYTGGGRAGALLGEVAEAAPVAELTDEAGIRHRLWPVTDPERVAAWQRLLAGERVLIADGHHRYRASLAYRDELRAAAPGGAARERPGPGEALLAFLVDVDQHGPSVLPIHRLLTRPRPGELLDALAGDFRARLAPNPAAVEAALGALDPKLPAFGLYSREGTWVLVARDPERLAAELGLDRDPLDVEVLHGPVLAKRLGVTEADALAYAYDLGAGVTRVDQGEFSALAILRPVPFDTVVAIAHAGGTLPPKSTSFYPKPRDGLVLRPLEPEALAR